MKNEDTRRTESIWRLVAETEPWDGRATFRSTADPKRGANKGV